jgi:serine/threonine-protein kinase
VQPGYCSIAKGDCEVSCRRAEESRATYGAIAFSPKTGAWGESYPYGSRAEAERRALAECAKNAPDCTVAVWFNDQCGAVASAKDGTWADASIPT